MVIRKLSLFASLLTILICAAATSTSALAVDQYYKDVCSSGCTYSSIQVAIDSITASDASHVYTVFVDSGVLNSSTSITTNGKSYINFVGRGIGVSVIQATGDWFVNANAGSQSANFFDISGSHDIVLRALTIDAHSQLPPDMSSASVVFTTLKIANSDRLLIESAEVKGVALGIYDEANTDESQIQISNARVFAANIAVRAIYGNWNIVGADLRAINVDGPGGFTQGIANVHALALGGGATSRPLRIVVSGSTLYSESSNPNDCYLATVRLIAMSASSTLLITGSRITVRSARDTIGNPFGRMFGLWSNASGKGKVYLAGNDILYENTVAPNGTGEIGGVGFENVDPTQEINLAGVNIIDGGGSGIPIRGDIVWSSISCATSSNQPVIRAVGSRISTVTAQCPGSIRIGTASLSDSVNTQKGTTTFAGQPTATVTLPVALPDTIYRVTLSSNANEVIWVTGKTKTGFTINSSNLVSTAAVDWVISR